MIYNIILYIKNKWHLESFQGVWKKIQTEEKCLKRTKPILTTVKDNACLGNAFTNIGNVFTTASTNKEY